MKGRRILAGIISLTMVTSAFAVGVLANVPGEEQGVYQIINAIEQPGSHIYDENNVEIESAAAGTTVYVKAYDLNNTEASGEDDGDKRGLVPEVYVTGADATAIEVNNEQYNKCIFSFVMPEQDVTVTAEYKPAIVCYHTEGVAVTVDGKPVYCADPGETVTLTPPTLNGLCLYDFVVEYQDASGNPIPVETTEGDGCITFEMPDSFVIVTAMPKIAGYQMLLTGAFELKYRVGIPDGYDASSAYMMFEVGVWDSTNNEYFTKRTMKVDLSDIEPDDEGTYWVSLSLNPMELGDTITATLNFGSQEMRPNQITALDYLNNVRAKADEENDRTLVSLVDKLERYAAVLNILSLRDGGWSDGRRHTSFYDDFLDDELFNKKEEVAVTIMSTSDFAIDKGMAEEAGIADVKMSLTIYSMNVLHLYVKPEEGVEIHTNPVDIVEINGETYYQFDSEELAPTELGDMQWFVINTSEGTAEIYASALSYVHTALENNKDSSDGVRVAKNIALVLYYEYFCAAREYQLAH